MQQGVRVAFFPRRRRVHALRERTATGLIYAGCASSVINFSLCTFCGLTRYAPCQTSDAADDCPEYSDDPDDGGDDETPQLLTSEVIR